MYGCSLSNVFILYIYVYPDALIEAIEYRQIEVVKDLIAAGADVNKRDEHCFYGNTPLLKAISRRDVEIVKLLIKAGADVDKVDNLRLTALFHARIRDYREIVKAIENFKTTRTMITAIQTDEARTLRAQGKTKESARDNVSDSKSHHSYLKR